jgi:putative nucleotidyltransferase with HDIG domain
MTLTLTKNTAPVDAFLTKHQTIHALPENAGQIMRMTSDVNCDSAQLVMLIEKDAALAAAIMKAVNSAFFALPAKMTRLDRAVAYLGMKTVKEVSASACLSKLCKPVDFGPYTARDLWDHGIAVAIASRELANRSKMFDGEEAFLLGILHDIGLILAAQSEKAKGTELLTKAQAGQGAFADLEQQIFGFSHTDLGGALARKWSFQEAHARVIEFHHSPQEAPEEYRALCNHLYVADTMVCRTEIGCPLSGKGQPLEPQHLQSAGISQTAIEEVTYKLPLLARLHLS